MSNRLRRRSPRPVLGLLALAALLAACDSTTSPRTPDPAGLRIMRVAGDEQRGVAGQALLTPVTIRVLDPGGTPVEGVRVHFAVTAGGGALVRASEATGALGEATAVWRLGEGQGHAQTLVATVEGGTASATFGAHAVPRSEADVVVVRGVGPAGSRVVLLSAAGTETHHLPPGDSVLLLPPRGAAAEPGELAVLSTGRRPALVSPVPWTAGRDTVEVRLEAPLRIPLAVWIVGGAPFEQQAAVARAHLAYTQEAWANSAIGLEVGEVEIRPGANEDVSCENGAIPGAGWTPGRVNIYYVPEVRGSAAYACSKSVVVMGPNTGRWTYLLAHEVGHTLGLWHTPMHDNVMLSPVPGSRLTDGQAFLANFSAYSALHMVYGLVPPALARSCASPVFEAGWRCLPETFAGP